MGRSSKSRASNDAVSLCQSHGGVTCTVRLTYHNQCAAVAQGPDGGQSASASAPTLDEAKAMAIGDCEKVSSKCSAIYSECSYAEQVQ